MQAHGEIFRDFAPPAPPEARQHYGHRPPSTPTRPKRAPQATGPGTRAVGALGTRPITPGRRSGAHTRPRAVATAPTAPLVPPLARARRRAAAHARRPAATRTAAERAAGAARAMEGAAEGAAGTQGAAAGAAAGGAAAGGRAAGWRLGGGSAGRLGGGPPSPVEAGRRGSGRESNPGEVAPATRTRGGEMGARGARDEGMGRARTHARGYRSERRTRRILRGLGRCLVGRTAP